MSTTPGRKNEKLVAVITGGNSGVGLTAAERLLDLHNGDGIEICLVCRNRNRAEAAKNSLLRSSPNATVDIVLMDTSRISSVIKGARELCLKYKHIDLLYLNAGAILVRRGINWSHMMNEIFDSETPGQKILHMFTTGEGLLLQTDNTTNEGLQQVFATNLFGHYVLVRELESLLGHDSPSQVIWTSSRASIKSSFNISDIQHKKGHDPYGSSKFGIDVMSVALNDRLNTQKVYSHACCPGLVLTNLTNAIFPMWVWYILLPFFLLMRIFVANFNLSPYNGSESLVWLSKQNPKELDPKSRYESNTSFFGKRYVSSRKDFNEDSHRYPDMNM
ncbi:3-keto-steroid reductase/17-beta-hydroxysteroid dehydrogenase 7-like isoform X2 [Ostrea edulis]|uniref:3-keto-steroid reductase/17-beta-hydroxysteroid dehydrogenase 7-like isoform X2 n=1 Tax=Ostrea edulis TaxID=37623 RepID=UPI0024AE9154|nr:3-keto-steroid reductase/17-beta-hydroxysteroid dehydrogenase 7-like isoform X2 [Ostrea edulis]